MIGCNCEVCSSTDAKDNRLRSSILIQSSHTTVVIDTTPDFRYQMLRINNKKLDAVVFTHSHKDHIAGLDDIRAYNYFQQKDMEVYANTLTAEHLKRDFYYAFAEHKYPGVPKINLHIINDEPFVINDIPFQPITVWHLKMKVFGYRIGNFTYITDANRIDEAEKEKVKGSEMLVLNALRKEKHISHFTLDEAIALADELQIPNVYLTHISHQLGKHKEVNKVLPSNIQLAYDGLTITTLI
ncbi:MAG: MBL fold metallo-hydrolase [Chitinophaga sp.]|nr:MBL fold metallo-hydrolase [Chitinophaga sp.]